MVQIKKTKFSFKIIIWVFFNLKSNNLKKTSYCLLLKEPAVPKISSQSHPVPVPGRNFSTAVPGKSGVRENTVFPNFPVPLNALSPFPRVCSKSDAIRGRELPGLQELNKNALSDLVQYKERKKISLFLNRLLVNQTKNAPIFGNACDQIIYKKPGYSSIRN